MTDLTVAGDAEGGTAIAESLGLFCVGCLHGARLRVSILLTKYLNLETFYV
jgi:hypothetical protein